MHWPRESLDRKSSSSPRSDTLFSTWGERFILFAFSTIVLACLYRTGEGLLDGLREDSCWQREAVNARNVRVMSAAVGGTVGLGV